MVQLPDFVTWTIGFSELLDAGALERVQGVWSGGELVGQVKSWDWRQHQGSYCAGCIWVVYSGDLIWLPGFLGLARKGLQ